MHWDGFSSAAGSRATSKWEWSELYGRRAAARSWRKMPWDRGALPGLEGAGRQAARDGGTIRGRTEVALSALETRNAWSGAAFGSGARSRLDGKSTAAIWKGQGTGA